MLEGGGGGREGEREGGKREREGGREREFHGIMKGPTDSLLILTKLSKFSGVIV